MGKIRAYSQSVGILRLDQMELLMSLLSKRDLPVAVREGLRLRYHHGYTISHAAIKAATTRQALARAESKLLAMHESIASVYRS